ncbi:LamG-like jellyroll fold domain-containing protein [Nonomuraea bangladeshensis]|uniref:LamG-like jellyroll fold domain-containing protein n=1 Tax=Nonomuraea bangladeshensis TaxID=404385 RepID=A0ABV3GYQ2_9ACTN
MSAPAIAQGPTPPPATASKTRAGTTEPTLKAAWDQAAKTGKPVEVPTHSTETMKVWANPDGKNMRAELHTRPVQLKNAASGAWEPIDTRIVTRDGKLQATRVKTPLTFGGRGAKQLVSAPGKHGEIGLGVTRALPEPKVSGDAVTYPDAVAPGADLVVLAQADGFISQVVFRRRPTGPVTVRLPLTLPEGTTFGKTPQGLPQLKDTKGEAKAAPIVLTATDAKVEAAPDQGRTHPVKAQVETTGKTSELVFTPDEKFLADPAVTYPVTVAASSTWFGGGAPDDAWISKNDPYNNNSAAGYLRVGTTSTSADVARVYLKFNTSDPVLQGATVNDADLRIWNYKSGGPNGQLCGDPLGGGIRAARVTGEWTLDGTPAENLDWYNQPSNTAPETVNRAGYNYDADPATWCAKDEELFYEVTAMTRAWIQQGAANHGIVLKAASETAAINWRQYYSSQFGGGSPYPGYRHPPALIIDYTPAVKRIIVVPRAYEGATPPETSYEEDKAWLESGNVYFDELPPAQARSHEEAIAEAQAKGDSAKTRLVDAFYPDDLTDQQLEDAHDPDLLPSGEPGLPEPNPMPEDNKPPSVLSTEPTNGQSGASVNNPVTAFFSEEVTDAQVVVKNAQGVSVSGNSAMDDIGDTLIFAPDALLAAGTTYTAEISGAKDLAGNQMSSYSWSFTTGEPDAAPPTVTGTEPGENATDVSVSAAVKATFNEAVSEVALTVKNPAGTPVQGALQGGGGNAEWTFTPIAKLSAQTVYKVEMSGAKDTSGNVMAPYTWSFTTGADTPPPVPGLVAAYGMNEGSGTSVADSSGQNNPGTGSSTAWANGKYGKALSFNGSSSMVTVAHAASLRLTAGMTLSAWVNPATVTGTPWKSVVTKELNGEGASYALYAANGSAVPSGWVQTDPETPWTAEGTSPLPVNSWSHLALTYDGAALRLFVNGQQIDQTPLSGSLYDDGNPLRIGGNVVWNEYFSGLIDEVRIYNRAQTTAEIQTDMTTPIGQAAPPDTQAPTAPGSLAATGGPGNAQLTWTASTDNVGVTAYTVHRSTTLAFTPSAANQVGSSPATTFTDAGLAAGTYYYRVRAADAAGNLSPSSNEVSATVTTPPATPGLVAAYGMNEGAGTTVGDSSGQHNTGAATDTTWANGKHGKALSFNGTSSWVTVPHARSLRLTNTLTLSAWVQPATVAGWRTVLSKENTNGHSYGLYASYGGNPLGWLENATTSKSVVGDDPLPVNQWSHLAVTYNGSIVTLYLNGTQIDQTPMTGNLADNGGVLRLGGNNIWLDEFYSGLIDDVRIYNRVQTAAEIQTDMNTPVGSGAPTQAEAQRLRTGANLAPAIEKLTVDDSRSVGGDIVTASLTPHLTAWLSAQPSVETKVEMEVANKPIKTRKSPKISESEKTAETAENRPLIWTGQATAKPGDSRVTLQIPKGKLRAGLEFRWRARLTGAGSAGAWTEWRSLGIDASQAPVQPTAAQAQSRRMSAEEIKRILRAAPQGVVPTPTLAQCQRETASGDAPYAWSLNRFNHCRYSSYQVVFWEEYLDLGVWKVGRKIGTLTGHVMTYLEGKLNRREFYVRQHHYITKVEGDIGSTYVAFSMTPRAKTGNCPRVSGGSGTSAFKTIDQWKRESGTEWHETQLFTSGPGTGYHLTSECTMNYAVITKHPIDFTETTTSYSSLSTFRCDASPMQRWHKGGGCVVSNVVPAFTMARNDVSSNGVPYKEMYDHVKKALTRPQETVPAPGGASFPDLQGIKDIKGGSELRPLRRHGYEPIQNGSRSTAKTVCDLELADEKEKGMDCDEFPFASTLEGAQRATPFFNFSVQWVDQAANRSHGTLINAWYDNNRMINYDKFWIDLLD